MLFGLVDVLFILLLVINNQYIVEFLRAKGLDPQFDFMVEMTWPKESRADIDLHVRDPNRAQVYYRKRESGFLHLDQDDRGIVTDRVVSGGVVVELKKNIEKVSIRKLVPGCWYTINAHKWNGDSSIITPVTLTLYDSRDGDTRKIFERKIELKRVKSEETAFRICLNKKGVIARKTFEYTRLSPEGVRYH